MKKREITFDTFARALFFVGALVAGYFLIRYLWPVLLPFFIAWMLAYMLFPVVKFFQYKCHLRNRVVSIIITLLLAIALVSGVVLLILPVLIEEVGNIKSVAINFIENGTRNANIPDFIENFFRQTFGQYDLKKLLLKEDVQNLIKDTVPQVWDFLWTTAGTIVSIVASLIALLYLFFLLLDYEHFSEGFVKMAPKHRQPFVRTLMNDVDNSMGHFFRGQSLVALSNTVMFVIGFVIIGFPAPIALGVFIGVISFVPYLQVVGFLPATILALLQAAKTGDNFWMLIGGVCLVYLVVQILQDTIFTPRIMGKMMGLRPAIVLLSLSVGAYILGIIGLILALPVTTIIISYYKRYISEIDAEVSSQTETDALPKQLQAVPAANADEATTGEQPASTKADDTPKT
ncbi:MAG: AI-2E family transporter [Bacteroidaceae bacterium]|nr:AI-2E family transporter [Bacteroidaceae bacterium]